MPLKIINATPMITATKMLLAGLIAFIFALYFALPESVWSLVTIAAVTQAGLNQTLVKSLMRTIGTLIGACIGYAIALFSKNDPVISIMLVFFVVVFTSYLSLQPTIYSYAGIITGMTIAIIVFFGIEHQSLEAVAVDRTVEVIIGIVVLTMTNIFLFFIALFYFPSAIHKSPLSWRAPCFRKQSQYLVPSLKVGFACMITFFIWYYFQQPQGYWAIISCLLIMEENQKITLKKGFFRFMSHVVVMLIGLGCMLFLLHAAYVWRAIPLLITFFLCGYLIGEKNQYSSIGNTMSIAMAIILLTNPHSQATLQIIFERFYNVIIGISVSFAMLLL